MADMDRRPRPSSPKGAGFVAGLRELVVTLALLVYYWLEAVVKAILPASIQGKDVAGETVLITGAGSGIGRLMALRFAKLKCRIVLWDINKTGNEETAAEVRKLGMQAHCFVVDLCSRQDIYATADKVKKEVGQVDILVNNAGIVTGKRFLECSDDMIEKTMQVNINAHYWTVKSFLPGMLERNHGHIVNIASGAGLVGVTGLADYCASKFAAVGFDESLRFELHSLGKTGVHTTVVCPYYINTGMFDGVKTKIPWLLPILDPEDSVKRIVDAVLCNQAMLCLPKIVYVVYALKCVLPSKCIAIIGDLTGVSESMDDFKGRQKKIE